MNCSYFPLFLSLLLRKLLQENRYLQESYQQELKSRSRLSLHNEELQYKLKHNSEKFTMAINELSTIYTDRSAYLSDCKRSLYGSIQEILDTPDRLKVNQANTGSPPSSPIVKGVVEKSESVSWVLDVNDEESAGALAERIIKRSGSFRGIAKERSIAFKRQFSIGANALSTSASSTSVLRGISESPIKNSDGTPKQPKSSRRRSNSLNVASDQESGCSKWQSTSTPIAKRSIKKSSDDRASDAKCGPSVTGSPTYSISLSTADIDDIIRLPEQYAGGSVTFGSQNHIVDPFIRKRPQIKEAGGEAMIAQSSCTYSEDDQSLGSASLSTSTSNSTSPSHSDSLAKVHRLPIDDETLMHEIVTSLSTRNTPMEVSWSHENDQAFGVHNESSA